jgi:hypothetical protein
MHKEVLKLIAFVVIVTTALLSITMITVVHTKFIYKRKNIFENPELLTKYSAAI